MRWKPFAGKWFRSQSLLQIEAWAYFFSALLILTLPLDWLVAAVCAAAFHEICHIAVIRILGGMIGELQIGISGAAMEVEIQGRGKEFLCALAGPVGSFLLLFLCHVFPKLSICGCIQGLFNLLPIYPLDGGRMLKCLLPSKLGYWMKKMELILSFLLLGGAVRASIQFSLGYFPALAAVFLIIRVALRKIPCKRRQIRVQ